MRIIQKYMIEHALYPAMEQLKGNRIRPKLVELKATERLSAAARCNAQTDKLTKLLLHCVRHVPAYQALEHDEREIALDPLAYLQTHIPALSKAVFQANPDAYLADSANKAALIPNHTGGSTGEPVHFYMTRDQVESYEAARWRGLSWYGITQGSRSVMIWGNPIELTQNAQRKYQLREQLLKNRIIISAYQLSGDTIREKVRQIERYKPEYLYGYSSALTTFAEMMKANGVQFKRKLKAVVSTSETLTDAQKAIIQEMFHCPIANEYGARDAGILAYSCPEGHLHITAENSIIEVLDPVTFQPLPEGKTGVLAVTDLGNFAQPRLRYLLGDVGSLSSYSCGCGRTLPLLGALEGREDAMLVGANGQIVHGNVVGQLVRRYNGVRQFRFVQHSPTSATLMLVLASSGKVETDQIVRELATLFPDTKIELQIVNEIPPTASGKMRYAVREFSLKSE